MFSVVVIINIHRCDNLSFYRDVEFDKSKLTTLSGITSLKKTVNGEMLHDSKMPMKCKEKLSATLKNQSETLTFLFHSSTTLRLS